MNVDPRGPRFGAAITTVVLAIVLLTASGWLLFAQTLVFALNHPTDPARRLTRAAQANRTREGVSAT